MLTTRNHYSPPSFRKGRASARSPFSIVAARPMRERSRSPNVFAFQRSFMPARLSLISDRANMATGKRGTYRVVAVSLYEHDADEADRVTDVLKRAGWPKANRSLIVREAMLLLEQDIAGKDDEAVFRYFVERYDGQTSESVEQSWRCRTKPTPTGIMRAFCGPTGGAQRRTPPRTCSAI